MPVNPPPPPAPDEGSIPTLRPDQQSLYAALVERDQLLADMYLGGLGAIAVFGNSDRLAQAAHSFRELLEKLLGLAPSVQAVTFLDELEKAFHESKKGACWRAGTWGGDIDVPTRDLLRVVESISVRRGSAPTTRTRVHQQLQAFDPSGRALGPAARRETVQAWMEARGYFNRVSHHGPVDEGEFMDRVASFEVMLRSQMRPQPFNDFDEIDALLGEVEDGS